MAGNIFLKSYTEATLTKAQVRAAFEDYVCSRIEGPTIRPGSNFSFESLFFIYKNILSTGKENEDGTSERPPEDWCAMFKRIANTVYPEDDIKADTLFEDLFLKRLLYFGTPFSVNAGIDNDKVSSCYIWDEFQLDNKEQLDQIRNALKNRGGVGINISNKDPKRSLDILADIVNEINSSETDIRPCTLNVNLEVWHPFLLDFIKIKSVREQDPKYKHIFTTVLLTDVFMNRAQTRAARWAFCYNEEEMDDLRRTKSRMHEHFYDEVTCPYSITIAADDIFNDICAAALQNGEPFIAFKDNLPDGCYSVSLCTEILQPSSVINGGSKCRVGSICAARLNYPHNEWKDNLQRCVDSLVDGFEAVRGENEKGPYPIGIGYNGLAQLFDRMGVAFTDKKAEEINIRLFKELDIATAKAAKRLKEKVGYKGGPYLTQLTTVMPNSSHLILDTSPSVDPITSPVPIIRELNGYKLPIDYQLQNPHLIKDPFTPEVNDAISRMAILRHKYLSQGQSINFWADSTGVSGLRRRITNQWRHKLPNGSYYIFNRHPCTADSSQDFCAPSRVQEDTCTRAPGCLSCS